MPQTFQLRRGTTAEWVFANPILQAGEMGYETSTNRIKIGTGVDPWSSLIYVEASANSIDWSNIDNKPTTFSPTSHASTHETGGSDALTPASIGAAPAASPMFTGVITVAAGSAAAPAIVAAGDSNTGIAFPAADTAIISTAGVERFRVISTGGSQFLQTTTAGTGVGRAQWMASNGATVAGEVIVYGDSYVGGSLMGLGAGSIHLYAAARPMGIATTGAHAISLGANGVERFRVKPTGAVRFQPLASDPASGEAGDVYYNSTANKLRVYNGTAWIDLH